MIELPNEVWFLIALFLPLNFLASFANESGINEALQEEAKKAKYQLIRISRRKEDVNLETIKMEMMRDDAIRSLVRSLTITPWQIPPYTESTPSRVERFRRKMCGALDPDYLVHKTESWIRQHLQEDITVMTEIVKKCNNISEYCITWDERSEYHPGLLQAFLFPFLRILGEQLVILVLKVPVEFLGNDMPRIYLPKLQNLDIHLVTGNLSENAINQVLEAPLVFIHNLKDTLQTLCVRSTSYSRELNLGFLFRYLGPLPHLQGLSLCIPFDGGHLASRTDDFVEFIELHRQSLQSLEIGANPCTPGVPSQSWILHILTRISRTPLPHLRRLVIALRPLKADLTVLFDFLTINATTLENIKFTDRLLVLSEVDAILRHCFVNARLKRLCLTVQFLTPELLLLLAKETPHIMSLGLVFGDISEGEGCASVGKSKWGRNFFESASFQDPAFRNWGLQHIALRWKDTQVPPEQWLTRLESKLVEYIPALRSVTECPSV